MATTLNQNPAARQAAAQVSSYAARTGAARAAPAQPPKKADDGSELLARLDAMRKRLDELTQEKSRLEGELGAATKRCEEVESKSQAEFGCPAAELPAVAEQSRQVAEATLAEVETRLGMDGGQA